MDEEAFVLPGHELQEGTVMCWFSSEPLSEHGGGKDISLHCDLQDLMKVGNDLLKSRAARKVERVEQRTKAGNTRLRGRAACMRSTIANCTLQCTHSHASATYALKGRVS